MNEPSTKTCNFKKEQPSFTVEIDIIDDSFINSGERVQFGVY